METLGALALATEKPTEELMKKKPVGRTAPLITNVMWRNLMAQALYQIAVLLTLQFKGESIFGVSKRVNNTLIFNTFVLCQVFNEFNARNLEKKDVFERIHKNKLFMAIIGITLVLQVVMVEFRKKFANIERLNWGQWASQHLVLPSLPCHASQPCLVLPASCLANVMSASVSTLCHCLLHEAILAMSQLRPRQCLCCDSASIMPASKSASMHVPCHHLSLASVDVMPVPCHITAARMPSQVPCVCRCLKCPRQPCHHSSIPWSITLLVFGICQSQCEP
ncbi:Calcium-transporting ATPase 9, plasma membrane-type [Capsicum chinense]|nr:Calcium-transporting ATPase 9, plasma membrane-type [Capsicum chinense]